MSDLDYVRSKSPRHFRRFVIGIGCGDLHGIASGLLGFIADSRTIAAREVICSPYKRRRPARDLNRPLRGSALCRYYAQLRPKYGIIKRMIIPGTDI